MATERQSSRSAADPRVRAGAADSNAPAGAGSPDVVSGPASADRYLPDWGSIDSAPVGYAVMRSPWAAPLFLVSIFVLSITAVEASRWLTAEYVDLLKVLAGPRHLHP